MRKGVILRGFVLLFVVQFVSAEILIGQPNALYNIGDELNLSVTLSPRITASDFFIISLVCGDSNMEVYRNAMATTQGVDKVVDVDVMLAPAVIGGMKGNCAVQASYGPEVESSQGFEITNAVKTTIETDKAVLEPGNAIGLAGKAIKANGNNLNGFIDVSVVGTDIVSSQVVNDGKFNLNLAIPSNLAGGNYFLNAHVYEKSSNGDITNEGNSTSVIKVKSVYNSGDIALSNQAFIPGEELIYSVGLYDQTNQPIPSQELSITIYDPERNFISKRLAKSGQSYNLKITSNYTPGNWLIEAKGDNVDLSRVFGINELQNATFVIENGTLTIVNTGNVPYTKPIEVKIGGESDVIDLSLDVAEVKQLRLLAPDGDYDVEVIEGDNVHPLGKTFLTGNAISVRDIDGLFTSSKYSAGIWIALLIILAFFAIKYYRKVKQNSHYSYSSNSSSSYSAPVKKNIEVSPKVTNVTPVGMANVRTRNASRYSQHHQTVSHNPGIVKNIVKEIESDVDEEDEMPVQRKISTYNPPALLIRKTGEGIHQGQKEEAALISLKIRNMASIESTDSNAIESVRKAMARFEESGAKIVKDYNSVLAIFSSIKFPDAYSQAIHLAKSVDEILGTHNRKYVHKVAYGIGIHSGELISEHHGDDFKFTSAGNAVPVVKRLADRAQSEIAVSENAVGKIRGFVKLEKVQGENYWKALEFSKSKDGKYSAFIDSFMKRQKGGW